MRKAAMSAACLAALAVPCAAQAQTREVPVCPSREDAEAVLQGGRSATLPEGCRMATVRRLDTPAGTLCAIAFGTGGGVVGALRDAVAETEWWTACANLRAP
ncbi:hypothetical protein [Falsiroseomonas sp. E2-1-a20]|uniref:hypothetical protein n=1 Tax=Falsiroseomonas sp. E2-1-a20 TaxID=3239300 RepID=UPI003F2D8788